MKPIKKILFTFLFVFVIFGVFACSCNPVEVTEYFLKIDDAKTNVELNIGDTFKVDPSYSEGAHLLWSSSNESVVKVENGTLTALASGDAIITIKLQEDEDVSVTVTVTVKAFNPTPIEGVLKEFKNNDALQVEGIVYGIISNGFYVADSEIGRIFVIMGADWKANVKLGDKVQITGKYGYVSNFPQIKSVTFLNVVNGDNASPVNLVESDLGELKELSPSSKTGVYGKLMKVTGLVGKNSANIYTLTDDLGNVSWFNKQSNVSALDAFLDQRVTIDVILHNYETSDNVWNLSFCGKEADITVNALSFDDIMEFALEDINARVVKEAYGKIDLPSGHEIFTYITYTWSVDANDVISIANNKATVAIVDGDNVITLKVEITNGVESRTVEYPVTFKGIVERTIASLKDLTVNLSVVKVRGVVVGKARNQSLSIRTLIVMQPDTGDTITIDFFNSGNAIKMTDERFTSVKTGDEIVVTAEYRANEDRPTIMNVIKLEVTKSDVEFTQPFDQAISLTTEEDFNDYAANYMKYVNKLVKIENPFLQFSTTSTPSDTNWVRFGYSESSPDAGYEANNKRHYFAFLIAAQNENLGGDSWYKPLNIPFSGKGAQQYNMTIYAYGIYISDTYIAFIIPDLSCYQTSDADAVSLFLKSSVPTSVEKGTISLPTSHEKVQGEITWTSDSPLIDVETGVVTASEDSNVDVTLTAKYTVNDEEYTLELVVTVLKDLPLTVTELLTTGTEEQKVKVSGIIVGYVSDGNSVEPRKGVLIMDPTTKDLVMVCGLSVFGGTYGAYVDSEQKALTIGDEVQFFGQYHLDTAAIGSGPVQTGRNYLDVSSDGQAKLLTQGNEVVFGEPKVTITNNTELAEFASNLQYGVLVKLVGTKENPICLGGSSSSLPFNIKVFMNKDAASNDETKYGSQAFALKSDVNEANAGSEWYKELFGFDGPFIGPNGNQGPINFFGEMYVVVAYNTSTYYQMAIVNLSQTNLTKFVAPENVGKELIKGIPTEVKAGPAELNLKTTSELVEGTIEWSSSNEAIDLTNNVIAYVDNDTIVTLTATFTVEGTVYTEQVEVKVLKATSKLEVEEALFKDFPSEVAPGNLTFELLTKVLDVESITWSVDNTDAIDLENKLAKTVSVDTTVKFTATFTVRGEEVSVEKTVVVSASVTLDDVKASLAYGIPTELTSGSFDVELVTSHESITGEVTWSSSSELINLENNTVGKADEDTEVTLTASFTFKGNAETLEVKVTVLGPLSVSKLLTLTEEQAVRIRGILANYASDGNTKATRLGILLKDKETNDLVLVTGLSSLGGSYGAYVDSEQNALTIGDELVIEANYYLTTEAIDAVSSIENAGRNYVWVTSSDTVKKVSSGNAITWDDEDVITISSNDELAAFASNIQYSKIVKIVGTAENPILIGGSSSNSPFNLKVLMNKDAKTNDDTKYGGKTFALKNNVNTPNFDNNEDWYKEQFSGVTGPFVAPKDPNYCFKYTGVIYVVVTFTTGTYYQMSVVNTSNWNLTPEN